MTTINVEPSDPLVKGIEGCEKCGGTGYIIKSKEKSKQKPCKLCMERSGKCVKCNNTGKKLKDGKACKCTQKEDESKESKKYEMRKEKMKEKKGEIKSEEKLEEEMGTK